LRLRTNSCVEITQRHVANYNLPRQVLIRECARDRRAKCVIIGPKTNSRPFKLSEGRGETVQRFGGYMGDGLLVIFWLSASMSCWRVAAPRLALSTKIWPVGEAAKLL
jgi:hypothetical protein